MDRYKVVPHLVREPWNSQGAGVGFGRFRVVQHLVREP